MGDQLVRIVQGSVWTRTDLTDSARVVLSAMASFAHDSDRQPVYFAGWNPLALALGYPHAEPNSAGQKAVSRAVRCLTIAELVSTDPAIPRHHKRRYRLHLPLAAPTRSIVRRGSP